MTAEETELTFVRCPHCRSLMVAASARCKMCGTAFESKKAEEPEVSEDAPFSDIAPPSPSRIRQKTMSVNAEEVKDIKSRLNAAPVAESIEKPYRLGGAGTIPNRVEQIINRLEQQAVPSFESEETGAGFEDEAESEIESRFEASAPVEEDVALKLGRLLGRMGRDMNSEELETEDSSVEASESFENEEFQPEDEGEEFDQAVRSEFDLEEETFEEGEEEEEEEEEHVAISPLPQAKKRRRRRRKKRGAGLPVDSAAVNRPVVSEQVQISRAELQVNTPRLESRESSVRRETVPPPAAEPRVARTAEPQSSLQPRVEGALLGWFVNFQDEPTGRGTEIRSGRFFIGSQQLRPQDFVVTNASVSTPHCMVNADSIDGLYVQDLMSERGTFVRRADSSSYERVGNMLQLEHGDSLKIGEVELLLCLLPQRR